MSRFSVRIIAAALALGILAPGAEAQIIGPRPNTRRAAQPNWIGGNVGIVSGYSISDGTTGATWGFGSGLEYAVRFEHPTQAGISLGAQGSYATMPLRYSGPACSCDADATVMQFTGLLHYGNGYSFHPVYELQVGVIGYGDFRRSDDASARLGATSTDYDFKFSLGYGLGFGLSPRAAVEVVQELGTILHQRDGLGGSGNSYPRIFITRLGAKFAF